MGRMTKTLSSDSPTKRLQQIADSLAARRDGQPGAAPAHFLLPPSHARDMAKVIQLGRLLAPREPPRAEEGGIWSTLQRWLPWIPVSHHRRRQAPPPATTPRSLGRRVCIVGIHGWFPTKVLQTVVGVPKGTSERLCQMMEANLRDWLGLQPLAYFEQAPAISCVPLEGAGCIEERVERHWAMLDFEFPERGGETSPYAAECRKKGRDLIAQADTVIFVAHSQGAPVAALLIERLMAEGTLRPDAHQNVALLTLAGVFHGPFPDLRENLVVKYVEAGAARELFDLNNPQGALSVRIQQALTRLLSADCLLGCVASWMDQVVPLYSATLLGIEHANIWRAVYIDAHNYQPDLLSHLVHLALKLANAQVGGARQLLGQLTGALAGSLYQSNAHSTLYQDHGVFQMLLHWLAARERYEGPVPEARLHPEQMTWQPDPNPYLLPWTMRAILERATAAAWADPLLARDIQQLRELHAKWRPERKAWRELRRQLEPLHSKI